MGNRVHRLGHSTAEYEWYILYKPLSNRMIIKETNLCSKFLSTQIQFQNSNFDLESKSVFRIQMQVLEV